MKFNKLNVLIGVVLLPSWNVLADTIEQTLTFIPYNCASGRHCQYKASASEEGGLDIRKLSSYKMTFKSKPQILGVNVGKFIWSNGSFVVTDGDAAGQEVQQWPEFSGTVTFDGTPSDGGTGALPTEDAIIHHVTFPYGDTQTTIDLFNLNTPYATDVVISNLIAGTLYSYLVEKKYPEVHFNKEYLVGSILSQLLQEAGLADSRINPDYSAEAKKQAIHEPGYASQLLAVGQGGPYQINDYNKRLPDTTIPGSLGLINYDALYQGLGYTIDDQDSGVQSERIGPDSLEDIYFGPIAATYFQINDINRLEVLAGQLFGKDLVASGLNMTNNQQLTVADLKPVFVKVFTQLSYKTQQDQLPVLIDEGTVEQAFAQAIENAGVTLETTYSLSEESQRNALYDFLYQSFEQLESRTADLDAVSGEITGDGNGVFNSHSEIMNPIFSANPSLVNTHQPPQNPERNIVETKYDSLLGKENVLITSDENINKKSLDYYNSKKTTIRYKDGSDDIELKISGKGREEDIEVFKNGIKIHFSSNINKNILSMTGTFPHHEMFLLEEVASSKKNTHTEILPYIEINSNEGKYGKSTSHAELSSMLDFRLGRSPETKTIVTPVLSNKDHWFMTSLEIDHESKTIKPTITNTTHEARTKGNLDEILDGYSDVLSLTEEAIKKSSSMNDYTIESPNFCQSLQYGNMGCGITTNLNIESLLSGELSVEHLKFTPGSFRTNEEALQVEAFHDGSKYFLQGKKAMFANTFIEFSGNPKIPLGIITNNSYSEEDLQNDIMSFMSNEDIVLVEVKNLSLPLLKEDQSQRSNLVLESIRRVDLAFKSSEMEMRKESLHNEIRQLFSNPHRER
ncbi:hypothetical protein [Vibrio pectenicida]|uniref:Uncharacterized protein n=1 Tax=Vibrio pectenicida TaxID=62763 RepID=A0A427U702_9VIBR|nr:hypothetical protein [Vibrio pectenicida]RSD32469.1 hypothetical protein EJA03_03705 [Vibrio pectenicida]